MKRIEKRLITRSSIFISIFLSIALCCNNFSYSYPETNFLLRPFLLFQLHHSYSGTIAKIDSIEIVEIKDIGDNKIKIHANIRFIDKKRTHPVVLYARSAPHIVVPKQLLAMKTGDDKFDTALMEVYEKMPKENIFILEENFYGIRGFGQFKTDGICAIGLVESLCDDVLAQWHEFMHAAYGAGKFDIKDIHEFVRNNPNATDEIDDFWWKKISYRSLSDSGLLHYALIKVQMCCWPIQNTILSRKIDQPVSISGDEGNLDEKIQHRLSMRGAACRMWEDFLGQTFGHGRVDIQIELINKCPLDCNHCLAGDKMKTEPKHDMEFSEAKKLIENISAADEICFTGGEPFLYYNTVPLMRKGIISEEFKELVSLASGCVEKLIIDTCGLVIPTDTSRALYGVEAEVRALAEAAIGEEERLRLDSLIKSSETLRRQLEQEVLAFFSQFPDNVVLEISIDDEHADKLKLFKKDLRDIVRFCEVALDLGREIRYNVRSKQEASVADAVRPYDYKGRIAKRYEYEDSPFRGTYDRKTIRPSHTKFQGNAVDWFDPDITMWEQSYKMMEIDRFVENIFPNKTFLFISHDLGVFFDAHSGFMPNAPEISYLGTLEDKPIAEIMLDGILGRLVGFDKHPYLKYLYLARFFEIIGDGQLSQECLKKADSQGDDYSRRYGRLLREGGVFTSIVSGELSHLYFKRHLYIAVIDNLLNSGEISWLRKVLPHNTKAVWECKIEDSSHIYGSSERKETEMRNMLRVACIIDFVENADNIYAGINASVEAVIDIIKRGYYIQQPNNMALKSGREGDFSFVPFSSRLDRLGRFAKEHYYGGLKEEVAIGLFSDYLKNMRLYFGKSWLGFPALLEKRLEKYLQDNKNEISQAQVWLTNRYLEVCNEIRGVPEVSTEVPDIRSWFIGHFISQLEIVSGTRVRVPYKSDLIRELKNGALTPQGIDAEVTNVKTAL